MHPVLPLKGWDEAVDLGDRKRIATNKKRMKAKDLAQFVVLKMTLSHAVDGVPGLHTHHRRHGCNKVYKAYKGRCTEFFIAKLQADHGLAHEGVVACHFRGPGKPCNFPAHGLGLAKVVKVAAVIEPNAVKRPHRPKVNVV